MRTLLPSPDGPASDAGFTLLEVMVSTAVIGVTMAAATSFFVSTERATILSAGQQSAVQLAIDGIEVARAWGLRRSSASL